MGILEKEDYLEPRCLLGMAPMGQETEAVREPIPLRRVLAKLDGYFDRRDYAGADRHLRYWLDEARAAGDRQGEFSLLNERMGFLRKQGQREEAFACAEAALLRLDAATGADSIAAGTCYVNCGTVYDNFDMPDKALTMFEKARPIYEAALEPTDGRLGALYNNMALALAALGRFAEANALFYRALDVMCRAPADRAITWLNLCDAVAAEKGAVEAEEEIQGYLERAEECLEAPDAVRDGYYAFVCAKCAPGFDHYGWFAYAAELRERSESIYAGLGDRQSLL